MLISEKDQNKDHIMEVHWIRVSWQSVEPEWQPRYRKHNKTVLSPASVSRSNHISPGDIPRHHSPIKTCACVFTDVHVLAAVAKTPATYTMTAQWSCCTCVQVYCCHWKYNFCTRSELLLRNWSNNGVFWEKKVRSGVWGYCSFVLRKSDWFQMSIFYFSHSVIFTQVVCAGLCNIQETNG